MMHHVTQHDGAERGSCQPAAPFPPVARRGPSSSASSTSRIATWARLACAFALLAGVLAGSACRRTVEPLPPPRPPQTSGTLTLDGLRAPVVVVRDAWGIPHITAENQEDLFFAQGFVQAQDRLFQMDLWKRASQGRLSEVLGSNFIERDVMTRRIRFRGAIDAEWASYGPDAREIAAAFTQGINAWVRIARADAPEEFVLAGWLPEFWKPEDLLSRTDAFLASGNALDEFFRARLAAAIGVARLDALLPLPGGRPTVLDARLEPGAITFVVPDALRRFGTPPFVPALAARVTDRPRPGASRVSAAAASAAGGTSGGSAGVDVSARVPRSVRAGATAAVVRVQRDGLARRLVMLSEVSAPDAPSRRYLVHLQAPGWKVAGATSPWMPGVAVGHNEHLAWAMAPARVDTQDVFVERFNPDDPRQVRRGDRWVDMDVDIERIALKGHDEPYEYERQYTENGAVFAIDKERHLLYTLRWSGTEPGGAADLAALQLNRAETAPAFERALAYWQMPVSDFVYASVDGAVGRARAGRVPLRERDRGHVPRSAWSREPRWLGFARAESTPTQTDSTMMVADADGRGRRAEVLSRLALGSAPADGDWLSALAEPVLSRDMSAWMGALRDSKAVPADLEPSRRRLLDVWDPAHRADASGLIALWQALVFGEMTNSIVPEEFLSELQRHEDWPGNLSFEVLTRLGFARDPGDILLKALKSWSVMAGDGSDAAFTHPLAAFAETRKRFNVGPMLLPGTAATLRLSAGRLQQTFGMIMDPSDWSRTMIRTGPGQSGSPASAHYDDLAVAWAKTSPINLSFDQNLVDAEHAETLRLEPRMVVFGR